MEEWVEDPIIGSQLRWTGMKELCPAARLASRRYERIKVSYTSAKCPVRFGLWECLVSLAFLDIFGAFVCPSQHCLAQVVTQQ